MRTAKIWGYSLVLVLSGLQPVAGQRVQFPTKLPLNAATAWPGSVPAAASPRYAAPPYGSVAQGTTSVAPPPTGISPTYPPPVAGTSPTYVPPAAGTSPTYAPPATGSMAAPSLGPGSTAAPGYGYPPGVSPGYAPPPAATFQGTIQPPPTGWDPYATPGAQAPSLLPSDPFLPQAPAGPYPATGNYIETMQRLLDKLRVDYVWMPGDGPQELGLHEIETSATFAIPFFQNPKAPLLVTPGFGLNLWNGPSPPHPSNPEFPGATYAAFLDSAWNPQLTPMLSGELGFRIGVYSDFKRITNESIRYQGRGYFLLAFSPSVQVKAGVVYLDRQRIKLLPAGGVIWKPNSDTKFDILFPNPKLAWRLHRVGNVDWWLYGRGEYGGDSWTIRRPSGVIETDYNDIRTAVGLEFDNPTRLSGRFEVGVAFEREIYQLGAVTMRPNTTVFLGGGLSY